MNGRMPVSALQELMAHRGHPLPRYTEEGSGTAFKCTVFVEGISAVGLATSKKAAKHNSAENALKILQSPDQQIAIVEESTVEKPLRNFVGELNEYSSKNGVQYPNYEFVTALVSGQFIVKCIFLEQEVKGVGMTKKDAKQDAAKKMIKIIDPKSPVKDKFKITPAKTTLEIEDTEEIIAMFNRLSTGRRHLRLSNSDVIEPSPEIKIDEEDNLEDLERQLEEYEIEYTVTNFQTDPYIVCLVIKGTHFTFMHVGRTRKEALKKVYKNVLEVKKHGCSFNTDIHNFV